MLHKLHCFAQKFEMFYDRSRLNYTLTVMITSFQRLLGCAFPATLGLVVFTATFTDTLSAQETVTFTDHVLPLVEQHCAKCHNSDKKKGDLDLTSYSGALKGGG